MKQKLNYYETQKLSPEIFTTEHRELEMFWQPRKLNRDASCLAENRLPLTVP
tara:strand:+ start:1920 stop:2075 length:156 start_codon:yes stop_codon:yes gene_type:complete